jgi:hypothetical protein
MRDDGCRRRRKCAAGGEMAQGGERADDAGQIVLYDNLIVFNY